MNHYDFKAENSKKSFVDAFGAKLNEPFLK